MATTNRPTVAASRQAISTLISALNTEDAIRAIVSSTATKVHRLTDRVARIERRLDGEQHERQIEHARRLTVLENKIADLSKGGS
jgi:hypothetical protein